jgi:hypothetical protein
MSQNTTKLQTLATVAAAANPITPANSEKVAGTKEWYAAQAAKRAAEAAAKKGGSRRKMRKTRKSRK